MSVRRLASGAVCLAWVAGAPAAELLFVSAPDCGPCLRFHREVAMIYPKTAEARTAPMREIAKGEPPVDVGFVGATQRVPTFILVDGGHEVGRFEGYGGDESFWMNLAALLQRLQRGG